MHQSPHVCLVNCLHSSSDVRVIEKVGSTLLRVGFEVSWVGPRFESRPPSFKGIDYHFYEPARGRLGRLLYNHRAAYATARAMRRADVYIGVEPDSARVAVQLARRAHAKAIFDVHEAYTEEMLDRWTTFGTRRLTQFLVKQGLKQICADSDLVLGVSWSVLAPFVESAKQMKVARNCAVASFAGDEPADIFSRPGLVAIQGKSTLAHGTIEVVRAMGLVAREVAGARAIFFDNFSRDVGLTRACFDATTMESGAEGAVEVLAPMALSRIPDLLRTCDVGLVTYNRFWGVNSLPNKIFEYMALGLPVVAPSYSKEIKPIMDREKFGLLVDCERPEAIAEALIYLHDHKDAAREFGRNARAAFLAHHTFESELQPVIDVINDWTRPVKRARTVALAPSGSDWSLQGMSMGEEVSAGVALVN